MKVFTRPYWIFLAVTFPQCLIILYYLGIYGVISSLLEPRHLHYWFLYGGILGAVIVAASTYGVYLLIRRRAISWWYALLVLAGYCVFLFSYFEGLGRLLPSSIPSWMISEDEAVILPLALIMPSLMHALLLLVDRVTPASNKRSIATTTVGVIAVPAFWYFILRFVFPLFRGDLNWSLYDHFLEVTFIVLAVAFLFLIVRLTYLLILRIPLSDLRYAWLLKIPFTILLPLLGLFVYNGKIGGNLAGIMSEIQIIGDWSNPLYYAVVLVNGVLLALPATRPGFVRLGIFAARVLFYPFVTYFFIVFLPFFPFAIGLVLVGFGFLLLAPLLLFFFHTWALYHDWRALAGRFGWKVPVAVFLIGFAVLPVGLTISYSMDRMTLNTMLTHVYEPDYASKKNIELDMASATRVLSTISSAKEGSDFLTGKGKRKPYLTSYYQWLVLDNLTLSDKRLSNLEQIFLGAPAKQQQIPRVDSTRGDTPAITHAATTTRLSVDGSYYISQVDLTITSHDPGLAEFATRFRLPPGAWVRDYYLVINGKKVPGILAEKKSALWVYQQTRDIRRDPGILYYTAPDELILRVFPFVENESRQTGIEIIHRAPVVFEIAGTRIDLQPERPLRIQQGEGSSGENFTLVTAAAKAALPKLNRKPYLHFIIDRSSQSAKQFGAFSKRINELVKDGQLFGVDTAGAMVTVANYDDLTFQLDNDWVTKAEHFRPTGGFFLERAVKKALYANYRQPAASYPLFVIVSDQPDQAVYPEGMQDFAITMPEGDRFLVLNEHGISTRHFSNPMQEVLPGSFAPASQHVLAWPDAANPIAFLPDDNSASVVIKDIERDLTGLKFGDSSWDNGMNLYGMWLSSRLNPHNAGPKNLSIISNSFATHLLTPLTSFLSLENEAQRQVLLRKQQMMLSSMRPLDVGEEHEMAEPPLWVLALFLAILFFLSKRRQGTIACCRT